VVVPVAFDAAGFGSVLALGCWVIPGSVGPAGEIVKRWWHGWWWKIIGEVSWCVVYWWWWWRGSGWQVVHDGRWWWEIIKRCMCWRRWEIVYRCGFWRPFVAFAFEIFQ
jgi:hypothetical protein